MEYEEFEKMFCCLQKEIENRNNFYESIPSSLREAFFDNETIESYEKEKNAIMRFAFSENMYYDIEYFLYEWKSGYQIMEHTKEYVINTQDEILNYFKEIYFND